MVALALAPALPACAEPVEQGPRNAPDARPAFPEQTRASALASTEPAVETFADGLSHPWGMAFLPDGSLLVTERDGRLRRVSPDGVLSDPIGGVPDVDTRGQGGLLDVAVGPDFADTRLVYLTYAKPLGGGTSATAAARGRLTDDGTALEAVSDIFVQAPPSPTPMHYGSRLVFDGADIVYLTTGEHSRPAERVLAQDPATGYGKVLRLRPDGSVPPDNPLAGTPGALDAVWTLGHRNVQGAAIDPATGTLWTVEHGPRGGDELNLSAPGLNYGWPEVSYGINYGGTAVGRGLPSAPGFAEPVYFWDPVIAPGGIAFYDGDRFDGWPGDLLVASLSPGGLARLEIDRDAPGGPRVTGEERLLAGVGRIRDVEVAPDGAVLVLTDADDGAILRLVPNAPTN